jgi:hypothetical protein
MTTTSFQIVNGYVCFDCSDVALAKKGENPAHPPGAPGDPQSTGAAGSSNSQSTPAVTFGGSLSQLAGASAVQQRGAASGAASTNPSPYNPPIGGQLSLSA